MKMATCWGKWKDLVCTVTSIDPTMFNLIHLSCPPSPEHSWLGPLLCLWAVVEGDWVGTQCSPSLQRQASQIPYNTSLGCTWAPGLMFSLDLCCLTYFDVILSCFQSAGASTVTSSPTRADLEMWERAGLSKRWKEETFFYAKFKASLAVQNCIAKSKNLKADTELN